MELVNKQYDLVHYAGHGICDSKSGQTGWVFCGDCVLSAKEIFSIRQVPRLVFANACFSSVTTDDREKRKQMAGLAQAFFGRGILIKRCRMESRGGGLACARWFYRPCCLPGLTRTTPSPRTRDARRRLKMRAFRLCRRYPKSASWGAYQHYGHVGARLIVRITREQNAATAALPLFPSFATMHSRGAFFQGHRETPRHATRKRVSVYGITGTGDYAFKPRTIDDIAAGVLRRPGTRSFEFGRDGGTRGFALRHPAKNWRIWVGESISPPDIAG